MGRVSGVCLKGRVCGCLDSAVEADVHFKYASAVSGEMRLLET